MTSEIFCLVMDLENWMEQNKMNQVQNIFEIPSWHMSDIKISLWEN